MAYTVSFPTSGSQTPIDDVATWLTENGEPFTQEGPEALTLRALPVTIVFREDSILRAHVEVTASVKLDRMVEVLYNLALLIGADVCLADTGKVTRGELWIQLADVQDCKRVGEALQRADAMGRLANISRAMWGVLVAGMPGRDVRWDTQRECVVELLEVGAEGGISLDEAAWHAEESAVGDVIAQPVTAGHPHLILWRWLREAHPSVANA